MNIFSQVKAHHQRVTDDLAAFEAKPDDHHATCLMASIDVLGHSCSAMCRALATQGYTANRGTPAVVHAPPGALPPPPDDH